MTKNLATLAIVVGICAAGASAGRAADQPIPVKVGIVKPTKLAKFVAKGTFSLPAPGSAEDPTLHGVQIRIADSVPGGAGEVVYTLDKSGWVGLGQPPGVKGYKYKGRAAVPLDPTCSTVMIRSTLIKAICKGAAVTLAPPFLGSEQIIVGIPDVTTSAALRFCADLGGTPVKNSSAGLTRKDAPAPPACPFVGPTPTGTATPLDTHTATRTATHTSSATATSTRTATPTRTVTQTHTATATWTPDPLIMAATPRVMEATVHSIGFEWDILGGDAGHLATGTICYRKLGDSTWLRGSLLRVEYLSFFAGYTTYRGFDMFAGSLMFLEPGTDYEVQLQAGNPPPACGVGDVYTIATRPLPTRGTPSRTLHVKADDTVGQSCSFVSPTGLPPGQASSCDCAADPMASGCTASICNGLTSGSAFLGFGQADACAEPGDLFLVHAGAYRAQTLTRSGAPGQYISWVGDTWDSLQLRPQIALLPGTGSQAGVKALVLKADHLWFEGLDLVPAQDFEDSALGMTGIAGGLRPPDCALSGGAPLPYAAAFAQCQTTCQNDPDAHCDDYGTTDVVVVNNSIRNFANGVATGKWCTSFGGHFTPVSWDSLRRSIRWDSSASCEAWTDTSGAIWGNDPSRKNEDRHRADMHRHWYVADNVIENNYGPGGAELAYFTFLADSDIAYNRLAMTQHRSDWNTLRDELLLPECTLADDTWPTHAQCDIGGMMVEGACDLTGKHWHCPAEVQGWDSAGYCYCVGPTHGVEPDVMLLTNSTNIDIYGNDVRDVPQDNFIQADHSYANLRVWRNRVMNAPNALITTAPQGSAPWYIVRNEYLGWPGSNGDGTPPLAMFEYDRMVLVNNTFVIRKAAFGQTAADFLLRAVSRNNLWILEYMAGPNPGGAIWSGRGSTYPGDPQGDVPGQSHSSWRTDVDYDGFDWDTLSGTNVFWFPVDPASNWRSNFTIAPINSPAPESFQKWSRGCAGGPRDGLYCESDVDCVAASSVDYDPADVAPIVASDPSLPVHCMHVLGNYTEVDRQTTFDLCVQNNPTLCSATLDAYVLDEFSSDRLHLISGASSIDAGDPSFFDANEFYRNDIGADGRSIVPYVVGIPDLGAYEFGQPAVHYGPR